jgi:pilus assembly protein Flp/PilA
MRSFVMKRFFAFLREEEGASALEYALMTALIALVLAAGATILGTNLNTMFTNVGTEVGTIDTDIIQ